MAKVIAPPPQTATVRPEELYRWLTMHQHLDPDLAVWTFLVFSRRTAEVSVEAICGPHPGAQRLRDGPLPVFSVSGGGPATERPDGWFVVVPTDLPQVFRLIALARSNSWTQTIVPFVRSRYPLLAPLHLTHADLQRGLTDLEHSLLPGQSLRVVRASAIEQIVVDHGQSRRVRRNRSSVIYTDETLDGAFRTAYERGQRFRRLMLDLETADRSRRIARLRLSTEGWFAWSPLVNELPAILESGLLTGAAERLELFRHRGREERDYKPADPLQIRFEVQLFEDRRVTNAFGRLMLAYPRAVKALLHQNPYYHMSVSDEGDGSAFDLWILNPQRLLVIPRLRASEAAINRLVNYIVENFRDGLVTAYRDDE